ncbi:DUF3168 domain-containing protein [Microvirga sp. GCM10011540]|uniref:tail completion protein gp17 n=1 Tax=Microvirga sp. GCM10011540 TaxID=3317338 RepID=UPI00361BA9AA
MTSPVLALRRAILDAATADPDLVALMGGTLRLHDEAPRASAPVYALFGDLTAQDWSTDFDRGHEQDKQILAWAERFAAILDDRSSTMRRFPSTATAS